MGISRPVFRAALASASASALVLAAFALGAPASADPANPTPVSAQALPTAQVNGVVWTQAVSGGVDFVGGRFTESRPAGAAPGVDATPRANLFAFDINSGAAVGFNATTNAQVRTIAVSSDGSRVYIGGDFTVVNGQSRQHFAVLDRAGNLIAGIAPKFNNSVYAIVTRGNVVYVGGSFTAVGDQTRGRLASLGSDGVLLPFAPNAANFAVRALSLSPDGTKLLVGGSFTLLNGVNHYGLGAVNSVTGSSLPWATESVIHASGVNAAIYSLSTSGNAVYATAYNFGGDGNLEGSVSMSWGDGSVIWIEDCHGDTYSSVPFNDALYIAGHPHYCANVGGFGEMAPAAHRALGFSQAATHTLLHNTEQGPGWYDDFGGRPAPTLLDWYPKMEIGTTSGSGQAAWSVTAGGSYLIYGGEFPSVNGVAQAGLVRFQGQPETSSTPVSDPPVTVPPVTTPTDPTNPTGPTSPVTTEKPRQVATPGVVALGPSKVAVRWTAPKSASADKVTGYTVKAYKAGKLVKSVSVGATKRLVTISGLKKSTTYKIGVTAKNAHGSGTLSKLSQVKTKAKGKNVSATKKPSKVAKPTTSAGTGRVRAKWKAASTSGALSVSKYQVRVVLHGKTVKTFTISAGSRSKLVAGLKRHTSYSVSVRADNWAGWGSWSAARSVRTR